MTSRAAKAATLALVPARRGSTGFPGKNRKRIGGKSLVELAIEAAVESRVCDLIAVSTDDPVLLRQAQRRGVLAIARPSHLATNRSSVIEAVHHAIAVVEKEVQTSIDSVVILEPTTPLRSPRDIRRAIALNRTRSRPNVASVVRVKEAGWLCQLGNGSRVLPMNDSELGSRRQDIRPTYSPNGAVYVLSRRRLGLPWYRHAVGYVMPFARSIDIDEPGDLWLAQLVYEASRAK